MPSYYGCCRKERTARDSVDEEENLIFVEADSTFESAHIPTDNYEAPPRICNSLVAKGDCLTIKGLSKEYGDFTAVDDINVRMYDG